MSFQLDDIRAAVAEHGRVTRVVVAKVEGSAPREVGASMLIWKTGQSGTIGGGTLEWEASARAREMEFVSHRLETLPLGPALGQCCGGVVTLLHETFDTQSIAAIDENVVIRRVFGNSDKPLAIKKQLSEHRNSGVYIKPDLIDGWMVEPVSTPSRPLWIYGAGHVGRALVNTLSPMPQFAITWVDIAQGRFPADVPKNVTQLIAKNPAEVVKYAPTNGEHLIVTYSHTLDMELCHQLLTHGFAKAGVIGSKSKWARFRTRLRQLGHTDAQINRIDCPIGHPELGKHPLAIAVGVASALLSGSAVEESKKDKAG